MSREVVEKTLLFLQERRRDLLLDLDDPVSKWVFSGPDFHQYFSYICDWTNELSILFGKFVLPLHRMFLEKISDASIVSNSSMSATVVSPFQILPAY